MSKEMLINVSEGEECRIAIVEDGTLQELYVERTSSGSYVGNVYKGKVTNVEPSIQAAFVDYGGPKNGFLHITDVGPSHFPKGQKGNEPVGKKRSRSDRPPIQECLRRGAEVIVQVTKEGIGTKGPTLTTYLSVPGRFLVMMPSMSRLGVSRKIEEDDERRKLRTLLEELNPPSDKGFIMRTAAVGRPKKELQNDLNYLLRLWKSVEQRVKTAKPPAELYQESDLVIRTIRDIYSNEISRIICDNAEVARKAREFLDVIMPRGKHCVMYYDATTPLFHRYDLEREIEKIYSRRVELPGGGSLLIDQTEALVAVDVNSGRYRDASNAEDTAFKTNLKAAKELARQLRLRDLGGVIVIDFIDMRDDKHRRAVEKTLRDAIKPDRARTKVLRISRFGIVEMTRQRVRPSLKTSLYRECFNCHGAGLIKSDESIALDVIRNLHLACAEEQVTKLDVTVAPNVAEFLNNSRRAKLTRLEQRHGVSIAVKGDDSSAADTVQFHCTDARGSELVWDPEQALARMRPNGGPESKQWKDHLESDLTEIQEVIAQRDRDDDGTEEDEASAQAEQQSEQPSDQQSETDAQPAAKKRRRRGGRRRGRKKVAAGDEHQQQEQDKSTPSDESKQDQDKSTPSDESKQDQDEQASGDDRQQPADEGQQKSKRRRRRRSRSRKNKDAQGDSPQGEAAKGDNQQSDQDGGKDESKPDADVKKDQAVAEAKEQTPEAAHAEPEAQAPSEPAPQAAEPAAEVKKDQALVAAKVDSGEKKPKKRRPRRKSKKAKSTDGDDASADMAGDDSPKVETPQQDKDQQKAQAAAKTAGAESDEISSAKTAKKKTKRRRKTTKKKAVKSTEEPEDSE